MSVAVGKPICVVGASFTDLISYVPRLPSPGETLIASKFQSGFGGKGANQAVQAARLGSSVTIVSKVGDDVFGRDTRSNYESQKVDATYLSVAPGVASGVAPIAVDTTTGQNSIIIAPGACGLMSAEDIASAREGIKSCGLMICQLEVPMPVNLAALQVAKEEGLLTMLNTAPAPQDGQLPEEIWSLCDIVCPNEPELQMLTGLPTSTNEEVEVAAKVLLHRGAKKVLVTLGERGCAVFSADQPAAFVAGEKAEAKDTSGAGDSFIGAFAHYLQSGEPLEKAMSLGNAVAAVSVTREGTQRSFANAEEMESRKKC